MPRSNADFSRCRWPSRAVEATIAILRGLSERYEVHHGVRIQDAALVAAATLSHRYITDRFLPDKAMDLVDEAASRLRMEIDSMPTEIDQVDRQIMQLEIERTALKKEKDDGFARALGQGGTRPGQSERAGHGVKRPMGKRESSRRMPPASSKANWNKRKTELEKASAPAI